MNNANNFAVLLSSSFAALEAVVGQWTDRASVLEAQIARSGIPGGRVVRDALNSNRPVRVEWNGANLTPEEAAEVAELFALWA